MAPFQPHVFWLRLLAFTALTVVAVCAHPWGLFDKIGMTGWPNFFAFSAVVALSTWGFNEVVETVKRQSHHTVAPRGSRAEAEQAETA